jgi:hypothetical protein
VADAVINTASYLTDFQEGRKDAPPKPEDINTRTNPIRTQINNFINSTPVRQFVSNYGYGNGEW